MCECALVVQDFTKELIRFGAVHWCPVAPVRPGAVIEGQDPQEGGLSRRNGIARIDRNVSPINPPLSFPCAIIACHCLSALRTRMTFERGCISRAPKWLKKAEVIWLACTAGSQPASTCKNGCRCGHECICARACAPQAFSQCLQGGLEGGWSRKPPAALIAAHWFA